MRIRKPAQLPVKSFLFRPTGELTGKHSIGLSIEAHGGGCYASFNWCGSRRRIHLQPPMGSYMTNLSLPKTLSAGDVYVLKIAAPAPLILTIDLWKDGEKTEDIVMEQMDGDTDVQTVCANPETDRDRKFEEPLMIGQAKVAARRRTPVGRIESLRELPEGAVLYLSFHRLPEDQSAGDLMLTAVIGNMRRLCVIAAGKPTNGLIFWLQPEAAGEKWELNLFGNQPFSWSGGTQRGYDAVFLPAFSFVE